MSLYERDYGRAQQPWAAGARSGLPWWRTLSVTHWLIIINCAVFVTDALCGARGITLDTHMGTLMAADVTAPPSAFTIERSVTVASRTPGMLAHPIIDPATGFPVGEWRFLPMPPMVSVGHFSTGKGFMQLEVWRLLSFQFLHANMSHLLFNMIGLFFFGPVVERAMRSARTYLAFYLMCGICGALAYLTLNLLGATGLRIPGVLFEDVYTPLIGASAGVFGVLMAAAFVAGDAVMLLMFFLPMKVRTGAYLLAGLALFNLLAGGSNAGGDAAHVGGAIAGFFFIRNSHMLRDFFDFLGTKRGNRQASAKPGRFGAGPKRRSADDEAVDAVLIKVRESGMHSLSEEEKRILSRATQERRRGP